MKIIINATSITPLSFRNGRSDTHTTTLPYIPGSALLGGVAQAHTLLCPGAEDEFTRFFLKDARFNNLYPAWSEKWNKNDRVKQALGNSDLAVYPLPNTARTCKRFSGFQFDAEKKDDQHGVADHLFPWLLFALSGQTYIEALEDDKTCIHNACQEAMDHFEGFYRRGFSANEFGKPRAKEMLRTHTGINRATGTVQQQILYSRTVLAESSQFWGTFEVADNIADEFVGFVQQASQAGLIRVGNNRTRGLGRINLSLKENPVDEAAELAKLIDRLKQFNAMLETETKSAGIALHHSFYVPFTFISDAILLDHLLRPLPILTANYLHRRWAINELDVVYSNYQTRRVMGWNNLWRLPKADDLALTMGAVFVLGFNRSADNNLHQTLLNIQLNGIGERRNEGFGQLLIANPFHWEVKNV